ncbi:unnamed protein product [Clonostachys byssicola]|uniref:Uncharacterized protein n=1 Tax=Clonostachys byssicola TaxID=160290 RepID=A0A9N9U8F7_9HYPO|nr:unnamed protein product [Clonostachys byssicola]
MRFRKPMFRDILLAARYVGKIACSIGLVSWIIPLSIKPFRHNTHKIMEAEEEPIRTSNILDRKGDKV